MFTSLQTSFFQKSGNDPADLDEAAGQMFRADFLSDATFYGMMASEKPDRETGGFDMLKTRKERAYLIAILAVLAAIIGVIIFGLHLRRSAAKEAAAAATPRPTAEQKQGFSLVIFPEGKRSCGPGLDEFKAGSFKHTVKSLVMNLFADSP